MKESTLVEAVRNLEVRADREQRRAEHLRSAIGYIRHRAVGQLPETESQNGDRLQHIFSVCFQVLDHSGTQRLCPREVTFEMAEALRMLLHNSQQHNCATGCHIEKARQILATHDSIMRDAHDR